MISLKSVIYHPAINERLPGIVQAGLFEVDNVTRTITLRFGHTETYEQVEITLYAGDEPEDLLRVLGLLTMLGWTDGKPKDDTRRWEYK